MKPNINTVDTLLIGLYTSDGNAVALGSLNSQPVQVSTNGGQDDQEDVAEYYVRPDVLLTTGAPWEALALALAEAEIIGAANVAIFTNDPNVTAALTRLTPPRATEKRIVKLPYDPIRRKQDTVEVGLAWDEHHTAVLQRLAMRGGHWSIAKVEDLPNARKEWTTTYGS